LLGILIVVGGRRLIGIGHDENDKEQTKKREGERWS